VTPALQVRGVTLPEREPADIWIADGEVVDGPIADAELVAEGWIVPGFVDAHCHIGVDAHGAVDEATQEEQAVAERAAGVLLARDCGVPSDTRWIDERADLPRVIRAGQHIAVPKRYIRNYGVEVTPDRLVETVAEQAGRGDGWVKLVGDWIDREAGDLRPCWPADALRAAIQRAHDLGARVTAHVFGEDALPGLLEAGIDCLEHGTGLADDELAFMAEHDVALVPTLINIESFPAIAASAERFPVYAAHMLALHARVGAMVRSAYEAGVPIYAGTDAGGALAHGRIADEVAALAASGLGVDDALAAASWRARDWLGFPGALGPGAPADLVVLDADPAEDLTTLHRPIRVILRGTVVR
jgi:imidazolonepropionase-like amidohydrolase